MRPSDLFIEAARQVQPDGYAARSPETLRLDELVRVLKERTANVLDRFFNSFGISQPDPGDDRVELRIPTVKDETSGSEWLGESRVWITEDGVNSKKEITRRWVLLNLPAEEEFDLLAPEGFNINKGILVGTHDVRHSFDGGETWGAPHRTASFDAITGLFLEPIGTSWQSDLENGTVTNPFEYRPIVLERLNQNYPVFFDDSFETTMAYDGIPEPYAYPDIDTLIRGLHASIDDFEQALQKYQVASTPK